MQSATPSSGNVAAPARPRPYPLTQAPQFARAVAKGTRTTSGAPARPAAGDNDPGRGSREKSENRRRFGLSSRRAWLFVVPTLAVLAVVIGYPVIRAVVMSFQKDA